MPTYLKELVPLMTPADIIKGLNKFLKVVPDLSNDYPKITKYLSTSMFALYEANYLKANELVFVEQSTEEEEAPFVE